MKAFFTHYSYNYLPFGAVAPGAVFSARTGLPLINLEFNLRIIAFACALSTLMLSLIHI